MTPVLHSLLSQGYSGPGEMYAVPLNICSGIGCRARLVFKDAVTFMPILDEGDRGHPLTGEIQVLQIQTFAEAGALRTAALEAVAMLDRVMHNEGDPQ
jgi:hypothetical protein